MRFPSLRHTILVLLPSIVLFAPELAFADWPSSSTTNLAICVQPNNQQVPSVATDLAGGMYVVWQDARVSTDLNIYAQHVLSTGVVDPGWPANGRVVCNATGSQTLPRVVADGSGGAIVAWGDARGVDQDVYAHHLMADGSLDVAWPVNGRAVCTAAGAQTALLAHPDGSGGAVLAWRDLRNDTDLFAARVMADGQMDPAWPVNGLAIASGPGAQHIAQSAPDGQGGFFMAWQDTRNAPTPDVYAQHVRVNGTLAAGWTANGVAVCTAAEHQRFPSVSPDGHGGLLVSWEDVRNGSTYDIYAHHIRADGSMDPAWLADGNPITQAAANQTRARVQAEPSGGAFVAWLDARAGVNPALYAQHVLANGTLDPAWPVSDLPFNLVFAQHANLVLLPDGFNGALAVWDDNRAGLDVYAHHLLVNGSTDPAWPVDGRAVSNATGSQNASTAAIQDGSGGLLVAWADQRAGGGTNDIYAQRVQANGTLGGTVVDVPRSGSSTLSLAAPIPTPSRGGRLGLRFTLPREGAASVELLDVTGRRVAARDLGTLPAGPHAFDWSPDARLSPGVLWVRLWFGGETRMMRAVTLE